MLYVHLHRASEGKVSSMKTNLTEKDKRLLLIMFIFVVVVGIGYWGILPQIKKYRSMESEIEDQEVLKSVNEQKVANVIFVESQCEEYEAAMAENKEKFYDMMNEAQIDRMLTTMAIKNGLEAFSFSINIPDTPTDRKAYIYSDLYQQQLQYEEAQKLALEADIDREDEDLLGTADGKDKKESKDKKDKDSDDKANEQEMVDLFGDTETIGTNTDIYAAKVTFSLGGKEQDLHNFLNQIINSEKKILITSYSWGEYQTTKEVVNPTVEEGEEGRITQEVVTSKSLTISMEIYMCDKVAEVEETPAEEEAE